MRATITFTNNNDFDKIKSLNQLLFIKNTTDEYNRIVNNYLDTTLDSGKSITNIKNIDFVYPEKVENVLTKQKQKLKETTNLIKKLSNTIDGKKGDIKTDLLKRQKIKLNNLKQLQTTLKNKISNYKKPLKLNNIQKIIDNKPEIITSISSFYLLYFYLGFTSVPSLTISILLLYVYKLLK